MTDRLLHPYFEEAKAEEDELSAVYRANGNSTGSNEIISPTARLNYTDFSERRANKEKWARIHGLIDKVEAQAQSSEDAHAIAWEGSA